MRARADGVVMSMDQLRPILLSVFVVVASLFFGGASAENSILNRQLEELVAKIPIERTHGARAATSQHLAQLTRSIDPENVDDKALGAMVALLDSPDDAVRAWVAVALGNLGPRAKLAIPKLLSVLPQSDCLYESLSSAPAIRVAIAKIGGSPPPPPNCAGKGSF
jgi:hypothetical protein